jgi:hypothetical protein
MPETEKKVKELNFQEIAEKFKLFTPQQLRDQVIFNLLRALLVKSNLEPEELEILERQEQFFQIAQAQGC